MKNVLVTGGAGFIGSNFVRYLLKTHSAVRVINFDKLTYAGNLENLVDVAESPLYSFVKADICDSVAVGETFRKFEVDTIVHFAAESHVDRSIVGAAIFVETNVVGTQVLLDAARSSGVERFLHVSTDEVYGSLEESGKFTESTPLHPNSPYSASKAGSDLLALAYHHTYGIPVIVTRCSNNYGPYQFPEKMIPLMINNSLNDKDLPVYGDGLYVRDWLYVYDHCTAVWKVLTEAPPGEVYNIGGCNEKMNIEVIELILKQLKKPKSLIKHVKDRPGHDRRYAIEAKKIMTELHWRPAVTFEQGIQKTIDWYLRNKKWLDDITSGQYQQYYQQMYANR
jgi:dTDP-glucose 4,6-dehydratase